MNAELLRQQTDLIKEEEIKINQDPNLTRVFVIGDNECAKSTLIHILLNKTMQKNDPWQSLTIKPTLYPDSSNGMIYCEFSINERSKFLLDIIKSVPINKLKILFTVSHDDFRGYGNIEIIKFLENLSTNQNQLKKTIGIVITKGENNLTVENYLNKIGHFRGGDNEWCYFCQDHRDQIFLFPENKSLDRGKIINFLKKSI